MTHLTELERATIVTALKAWQIALERDEYDSALVNENVGTLTPDELTEFIAELERDA